MPFRGRSTDFERPADCRIHNREFRLVGPAGVIKNADLMLAGGRAGVIARSHRKGKPTDYGN